MPPHKNIRLLTLFNFFTDFRLYAPVAIIYFSEVTGSYMLGMSIFSIIMVSSALFEVPTGIFSDRIGRKKTVIFGSIAAVLFSIFYAIGQSFWILAIGGLFEGLSRSFYSGNNDALLHGSLAETKNEHQYDEFLGRVSSMFQAALAVSAIMGSFLAQWSFSLIMWISVVPQIICLFIAFQIIEPKVITNESGNIFQHFKKAYLNFKRNKKLRLLSASSILGYGFGEAGFQFQSAFYNTVWPLWAIGVVRAFSNLIAAISFRFSGRLIRKFGGINILIASSIYARVSNIVAALFPTIVSPVLIASTSLFYGAKSVSENSLLHKEFSNEQRATMGSLNSFGGSIFFGLISIILGFTADTLSPAIAFVVLQLFQLSNLWIYQKLIKHNKNNREH
ncbi:MAG TPA: MFS transporter [Candidatus Limnocylindrales bacterium]|nr:MFS transporter [Candidatus Limnocylindrales bacterium]